MTREDLEALIGAIPDGVEFWDCDDTRERLSHTDIEEAIYQRLEDTNEADREELFQTGLKVYGWTRKEVDAEDLLDSAVVAIADRWSEEYADPDDDDGISTRELEEALRPALAEWSKKQKSWQCDQDQEVEVSGAALRVIDARNYPPNA